MKPILFNTDMVKAILEGRKTVTRRVFNPKFKDDEGGFQIIRHMDGSFLRIEKLDADGDSAVFPDGTERYVRPPYEVGDILYVRETWASQKWKVLDMVDYYYRADYEDDAQVKRIYGDDFRWKPSIHMPKEAARLFLQVKKVDIQRLNDMQEEDAMAEGMKAYWIGQGESGYAANDQSNTYYDSPIGAFAALWNSTIKPEDVKNRGWDANPWVWVIEFEVIPKSRAEAIEKVDPMTFEEVCETLQKHNRLCRVCACSSGCDGNVRDGANGSIYYPCTDGNPAELADCEFARDVLIDYIQECLEGKHDTTYSD